MDHKPLLETLKTKGSLFIKEGNGTVINFQYADTWQEDLGSDWVFLLFDVFQIRSVAEQFSEVSLDIVDYASKPTIYHSPASALLPKGLPENGKIRFAFIRDKAWNGFLFQASKLLMARWENVKSPLDFQVKELFPLFSPNLKELFLSPEGDVKIIKG